MRMAEFHGFDWDNGNWPKCGKHGVSQNEIEQVFLNTPSVFPHPAHSVTEQRLKAIGVTIEGRHVYISFTLRVTEQGDHLIRPVSARFMHKKEIEKYEQQKR